jgi:SAM-dependent methyltransferase
MNSSTPHEKNADQAAYWNGAGGRHWTDRQELQDQVLAPVSQALFGRTNIALGERVIDIGCGCGATTLEAASHAGPSGHALGLDVSGPMLARARERTPPGASAEFIEADATVYPFAPGGADLLMSRFGVMFFAEPGLSFANMRKALKPGGRVAIACWRAPRENPWMLLPLQAAVRHVPRLPELGPEDPGAFSFADPGRVARIFAEAGFASLAMDPVDLQLDLAVGRGLEGAVESALEIGPASRAMQDQPEDLRIVATQAIREALAPHLQGDRIPLAGAIWIVTASNP